MIFVAVKKNLIKEGKGRMGRCVSLIVARSRALYRNGDVGIY